MVDRTLQGGGGQTSAHFMAQRKLGYASYTFSNPAVCRNYTVLTIDNQANTINKRVGLVDVNIAVSDVQSLCDEKLLSLSLAFDSKIASLETRLDELVQNQVAALMSKFEEQLATALDGKIDELACAAAARKRNFFESESSQDQALQTPQTEGGSSDDTNSTTGSSNIGAIVGGVVGAYAVLVLAAIIATLYKRKQASKQPADVSMTRDAKYGSTTFAVVQGEQQEQIDEDI